MTSSFSTSFLLLMALAFLLTNNLGINGQNAGDIDPDEKFAQCCQEISGLPADVAEIACKYPPRVLSLGQLRVLARVFAQYIGCYAAHKNNRECCAEYGFIGLSAICQDLCDGQNPPRYSKKYLTCNDQKDAISYCNKAAWEQSVASQEDLHLEAAMKLMKVEELVSEVLAELQSEQHS